MSASFSLRSVRTIAIAALLVIALSFAAAPSPARAAGLTSVQINAVIGLLQAFNVPQATINTVSAILNGGGTTTAIDCLQGYTKVNGQCVAQGTSGTGDTGSTGSGTTTVTFTASPTSGRIPLTVSFSARNVGSIDFGDGTNSKSAPLFFCGESSGCNTTWNSSHVYTAAATYTAKAKNGSVVVATKTITVSGAPLNCQNNTNAPALVPGTNCQDQNTGDTNTDDQSGDTPVSTVPSVTIQYPPGGEEYDTSRGSHVGTRILVQWRNNAIPAGSTACVYIMNTQTGTSYALQPGSNCVSTSGSQTASNQGYPAAPAGNYRSVVQILNSAGTVIVSGTGNVFRLSDIDRQSQEVRATIDSGPTYQTSTPTFTGSATVPKVQLTIVSIPTSAGQITQTLYTSALITVTNGRWSIGPVSGLSGSQMRSALMNEAGDVIAYQTVILNAPAGVTTGQGSPTEAVLNVTPFFSTPSLTVNISGSTGKGCDGLSYTIDFGDGSVLQLPATITSCNPVFFRSHSYNVAGTYTIKILPPVSCTSGSACAAPTPIITKTITVPGLTSFVPSGRESLTATLGYLPESFHETMTSVTQMLAAVEMAPVYVITDALSEMLYQAGIY